MCDFIQQIHPQASRGFTPRNYGSYPVARSMRIKMYPPPQQKAVLMSTYPGLISLSFVTSCRCVVVVKTIVLRQLRVSEVKCQVLI